MSLHKDNDTVAIDPPEVRGSNIPNWVLQTALDEGLADKKVLIDADDPTRFVTPRTALDIVNRVVLAGVFHRGATVCLHIPNDALLYLAILASGCIWTGTNTAYTERELCHHFEASDTRYVICQSEDFAKVIKAASSTTTDNIEVIVFTDILRNPRASTEVAAGGIPHSIYGNCHSLARTVHDLIGPSMVVPKKPDFGENDLEIAALMQTSGTTGLPKMAARTHQAIIAECKAIQDNDACKDYTIRRLITTPIFHGFTKPLLMITPLKYGHETYLMKRFDGTYPDKIRLFGITETAAPPPMLQKFVAYDTETQQKLCGLRLIYTRGAVLVSELRRQVLAIFDGRTPNPPRIVQVWGMTEGGWFTTFRYPAGTLASLDDIGDGSVGRPIDGIQVVVDTSKDYAQLENGERAGELMVKSQHLLKEYFKNPKATSEALLEGYLKTGDIGYIKNGKVYLIDRMKDLIKVNGWQVSPAEIENALFQHHAVSDAAVIGIGTGVSERPLCFVVATGDVSAQEIKSHLFHTIAKYKVASAEVKFICEIPKNGAGKARKQDLRRLVSED